MASPTALDALEATVDGPLRLYKRDAACFFDQFIIPETVRLWFGRPRLAAKDILEYTDMGLDKLRTHWTGIASLDPSKNLHPYCIAWPMLFAWSSLLAQSTLFYQCFQGGLRRNQVLSDDQIAPFNTKLNFALATDDIMMFARGNQ